MTMVTGTFVQMAWKNCGNLEKFGQNFGLYSVDKEICTEYIQISVKTVFWKVNLSVICNMVIEKAYFMQTLIYLKPLYVDMVHQITLSNYLRSQTT